MKYQDSSPSRKEGTSNKLILSCLNRSDRRHTCTQDCRAQKYSSSIKIDYPSMNRTKSTRTALFYVIVSTMFAVFGGVNAEMLYPVSTNTASGTSTSIDDNVDNESKYIQYPSGLKASVFLCANGASGLAQGLFAFHWNGSKIASTATALFGGYKQSLQLREPNIVIYATIGSYYGVYSITQSGSTYSFNTVDTQTIMYNILTGTQSTATYSEYGNNFLYIHGSTSFRRLYKRDYTNLGSTSTWGSTISGLDNGKAFEMIDGNSFMVGGDYSFTMIIARSNVSQTIRINNDVGDGSYNLQRALLDSADATKWYMSTSGTLIYQLYYTSGATSFSKVNPALSASAAMAVTFFNMGTLQYVALFDVPNPLIKIVTKSSFTVTKTVTFQNLRATHYQTAVGFGMEVVGNKWYFARIEDTNKNFQSYYLVFDNCTYRTETDVCTNCLTGYYRNTTAAGGDCILPIDFPVSYGIDAPNTLMKACQSTGCVNCINNYLVCVTCNNASGYWLYNTTQACYQSANFPVSYGPEVAFGTLRQCSDNHCLACTSTYQLCTICDTASGYYLYPANGSCLTVSQVPGGYGISIATGSIVSCSDAHCTQCAPNYSTCTVCNPGAGWYLYGTTCIDKPSIPPGKGVNSAGSVVVCSQAHCTSCIDDSNICLGCDNIGGYYLQGLVCVGIASIADGFGANTATGTIVACQDTNCLKCGTDYQVCTECKTSSGFYRNGSTCISSSSISVGWGINPSTNSVVPCQNSHCLDCFARYDTCKKCDRTSNYYLNDSACVKYADIVSGWGINTTNGTIQSCQSYHCTDCKDDYQVCTTCDTATSNYLYQARCVNESTVPTGMGIDSGAHTVVACAITHCANCSTNYAACIKCDTSAGYYASGAACSNSIYLPAGVGGDPVTGGILACQVADCGNCSSNYLLCEECRPTFYLEANGCFRIDSLPAGQGYNSISKGKSLCFDLHCTDCESNYQTCVACDETNGYYLQNSTCIDPKSRKKYAFKLKAQHHPFKVDSVDLSILVSTLEAYPDRSVQDQFLSFLTANLQATLGIFKSDMSEKQTIKYEVSLVNTLEVISISVVFDEPAEWPKFVSELSSQTQLSGSSKDYDFDAAGFVITKEHDQGVSAKDIKLVEETGEMMDYLSGGGKSTSLSYGLMLMLALDWTGTMLRMSQLMKLYSRLSFININFGKRLGAFLSMMGDTFKTQEDPDRVPKSVWNSKAYRGKLSKKRLSVDFVASLWDKIIVYCASWTLRMANRFVLSKSYHVPRWYLYVLYFAPKVHLIIFNLVFIDFYWVITRTILHSRGLGAINMLITCFVGMLLLFDMLGFADRVLDLPGWLRYVKFMSRTRPDKNYQSITQGASEVIPIHQDTPLASPSKLFIVNSDLPGDVRRSNRGSLLKRLFVHTRSGKYNHTLIPTTVVRSVDYKKTFHSIDIDALYLKNMSTNVRTDKENVVSQVLCRANFNIHTLRLAVYCVLIVACQYASGLCIGLLMSMEACKIAHALYCYVKYKYLKNIICLLMEVFQSVALFAFLTLCIMIHTKRFDELIMDFYQDAGIWIVIASCVAEYLLLLTYIGVATYDFFKNRKIENQRKSLGLMNFIHFKNDQADKRETAQSLAKNHAHRKESYESSKASPMKFTSNPSESALLQSKSPPTARKVLSIQRYLKRTLVDARRESEVSKVTYLDTPRAKPLKSQLSNESNDDRGMHFRKMSIVDNKTSQKEVNTPSTLSPRKTKNITGSNPTPKLKPAVSPKRQHLNIGYFNRFMDTTSNSVSRGSVFKSDGPTLHPS